jgi:hypothetical protein
MLRKLLEFSEISVLHLKLIFEGRNSPNGHFMPNSHQSKQNNKVKTGKFDIHIIIIISLLVQLN